MGREVAANEEVRAWREARCAAACPTCPVNCCEGRLNPRLDRLDAFSTLPVVRGVTDPRPLDGPYVVDRRFWRWGACFLVGRCPHLDEAKRCALHDDSRRPRECGEYPLHIQRIAGRAVLQAEGSCWIFQQADGLLDAQTLAARLGLVLHVAGGGSADGQSGRS